jgi:hypothetical protein
VLVAAAAVVAVVVAVWILQTALSGGGESSKDDSPPPYSVMVKRGGEVLKTYDLADLHALPQASVEIDGKEQDGPLLTTLLDDAGAGAYRTVVVQGAGVRDQGRLELAARQAARDVQLDFSDRGTVKVCSPWLQRREWVRDVLIISAD